MAETLFLATLDWRDQCPILYGAVKDNKAMRVLELGTDLGDSTRILAHALKLTGGTLTTVDILPPKWKEEWMEPYDNVTVVTCDALKYEPQGRYDILLIDDNHTYAHVKKELKIFAPFVRPGGIIFMHDTCHSEFGWDVTRAINEWIRMNEINQWVNDTRGHGLGIIQIPK